MSVPRVSLVLAALVFGGSGVGFLVDPVGMGSRLGLALTQPTAVVEIGAVYGGLEVGLAAFLIGCLRHSRWIRTGLALQTFAFGGLALARGIGMLVRGAGGGLMLGLLGLEVGGALLGLVAFRRARALTSNYR